MRRRKQSGRACTASARCLVTLLLEALEVGLLLLLGEAAASAAATAAAKLGSARAAAERGRAAAAGAVRAGAAATDHGLGTLLGRGQWAEAGAAGATAGG